MSLTIIGIPELVGDLEQAAVKAVPLMREAVKKNAEELRDTWRSNARATSGKHGRLYPNTITYETKNEGGGASAEIGPDSSKPQGRMGRGFEYGSVHQPPHLDGQKAADVVEPKFVEAVALVAGELL